PCAVEFVEHSVTRAVERLMNKTWPAREGAASLMIIVDGRDEEDTLSQAQTIGVVLEAAGALDVLLTDQKGRQAEILEMRSMLYEGIKAATVELFDVCVPRSEIAAHVALVHDLEARLGVSLPTFGHAADGNVHTHLLRGLLADGLIGPDLPDWREKRERAREAIYDDVGRRGGVVSGEHGIGLSKRASFRRNLSPSHLSALQAIKRALDPDGILNPGKIFEM
ncbi:MAG TPA: FAD-linked oxidase C-terminal domain-containing protein, partial [Spirochaetia bacterium]|nr:FAD-linked oxidase C-terminal domain-containing protein [Spirochaetia bacterium]